MVGGGAEAGDRVGVEGDGEVKILTLRLVVDMLFESDCCGGKSMRVT